jgi:hypothetical protein
MVCTRSLISVPRMRGIDFASLTVLRIDSVSFVLFSV